MTRLISILRSRGRVPLLAAGAAVAALALSASLPALADPGAPGWYAASGAGFHAHGGGNGEADVNVCSYAVAPGVAHCDARVRTDASALAAHPDRNGGVTPDALGNGGAYDPSYLQSAYNVASAAAANGGGVGQTVAIVDAYDDPNVASDLAFYRSFFSLPACPAGTISRSATGCVFEKVNEYGATAYPKGNSGWGVEISLDVEMVSAICPSCQILLVEASSATIGDLGTAVNEAVALGANVVSNSYGGSEYFGETSDASAYYNHPGIPIVASSGDSGYGVEFPAADPDVTAVGGTSLTQLTNTGTRNGSETAWSGAGAGCSVYEPKPPWQHDTGCAYRTVADVSAVADPNTGVWVYDSYGNGGWAIYGGTSVAAPIISSIYALAGSSGGTGIPSSYPYAAAGDLYDVTSGSDGSCSPSYLCTAGVGYDGPTGLGTPGGSPNSIAAFGGTPSAPVAPGAPVGLAAQAGNNKVSLSWSPPQTGTPPFTYSVFRATSPGGESYLSSPLVSGLTGTTFTDTSALNTHTYYYTVEATNSVSTGGPSGEASATPQAAATVPGVPIGLTAATSSTRGVVLGWSAPASNGGSAITSYTIYRSTSSGRESSYTSVPCGTATCTYTDTGTRKGTTYYYEVAAVNAVGTGPRTGQVSARAR